MTGAECNGASKSKRENVSSALRAVAIFVSCTFPSRRNVLCVIAVIIGMLPPAHMDCFAYEIHYLAWLK